MNLILLFSVVNYEKITLLQILNYVDIDSESEVLGYGVGLILLNVKMYVVAPVGIRIVIARKF